MNVTKVSPEQAQQDMKSRDALLVCAYDNEEKCARNRLKGAISFNTLQDRENDLSEDRELIFYCT